MFNVDRSSSMGVRVGHSHKRISLLDIRFRYGTMTIFISDTPLSPMGPSSPSQEGLFTDLRLLSLEKQLNIELKVTKLFLLLLFYYIYIFFFYLNIYIWLIRMKK